MILKKPEDALNLPHGSGLALMDRPVRIGDCTIVADFIPLRIEEETILVAAQHLIKSGVQADFATQADVLEKAVNDLELDLFDSETGAFFDGVAPHSPCSGRKSGAYQAGQRVGKFLGLGEG